MEAAEVWRRIREHYAFSISLIECVVKYPQRGVWKITAECGQYAYKYYQASTGFSVELQHWLQLKRLSPTIINTVSGNYYFMENGQVCYVSEWRAGNIMSDKKQYIKSVANFHREAQGHYFNLDQNNAVYGPCKKSTWLHLYQKKLLMLELWSKEAQSDELKSAFLGTIGMGKQMLDSLDGMDLEPYIEESLKLQTIVHWDLHRGNMLAAGKKTWIIDLDGASISFQVCDLHQAISELFDTMGLQPEGLHRLLKAYFSHYPHAERYRHIYNAVCQFPHYFWTIAERLAVLEGNINSGEVQLCTIHATEQRKLSLIKQW